MTKRIETVIRAMKERDITPSPEQVLQERAATLRKMRNDYARKRKSGELELLARDPVTGKRPIGTGRTPKSGWLTPHLKHDAAPADNAWRFRSRRERANALQERMRHFSAIYNAGYLVREAYFGPEARLRRCVKAMIVAMYEALCESDDCEAILFAAADAIYASPSGVPWEP